VSSSSSSSHLKNQPKPRLSSSQDHDSDLKNSRACSWAVTDTDERLETWAESSQQFFCHLLTQDASDVEVDNIDGVEDATAEITWYQLWDVDCSHRDVVLHVVMYLPSHHQYSLTDINTLTLTITTLCCLEHRLTILTHYSERRLPCSSGKLTTLSITSHLMTASDWFHIVVLYNWTWWNMTEWQITERFSQTSYNHPPISSYIISVSCVG